MTRYGGLICFVGRDAEMAELRAALAEAVFERTAGNPFLQETKFTIH